jgi:hypothetical protein
MHASANAEEMGQKVVSPAQQPTSALGCATVRCHPQASCVADGLNPSGSRIAEPQHRLRLTARFVLQVIPILWTAGVNDPLYVRFCTQILLRSAASVHICLQASSFTIQVEFQDAGRCRATDCRVSTAAD